MPYHLSASGAPRSIAPLFFLCRHNAIIGSLKRKRFAVLSVFHPGLDTEENLARQSQLVDSIEATGR